MPDKISGFVNSVGRQVDGKLNNRIATATWGNIDGNITNQTDLIRYIEQNGGKIDAIEVNGVEQPIVDKTVNLILDIPTIQARVYNHIFEVTIE